MPTRSSVSARLRRTAALALLAWVLLIAPANGQPREETTPSVLVAAALEHWPPQYSLTERGEPTGFAVEIFDSIAARAGIEVRYRVYGTFPEVLEALESGEVDVVPNLGITPAREARFAFTRPMETFAVSLFVRSDQVGIRGIEDLGGRPLAVVESNAAQRIVRERHEGPSPVYSDVRQALFDLLSGQVDALAYPRPVLEKLAREAEVLEKLRVAGPPLAEIKRAPAVRADRRDLLALLAPAAEELAESPEYPAIYSRWYGHPDPFWSARRVAWAMGLLLLVSLLAMGVWRHLGLVRVNRRLRDTIAEREEAEQALRREQARSQGIAENMAEGLIITDLGATIVYVNRRLTEMLGLPEEELLGLPTWELAGSFGGREEVLGRMERREEGTDELYVVQLQNAQGEDRWFEVKASPFRDAEGTIVGSLAALTDVTERRWAEEQLRRRDQQLAESQRLEAIGRLAGGIAHDFNNILTAILGYGELLLREIDEDDPKRSDLEQIQSAAERAGSLTKQLLAFGRRQILQPTRLSLDEVVRGMENMLARLMGERFDLSLDLGSDPHEVVADSGQIGQVLMNLVINARDAMPDGGTIEVHTGALHLDDTRAAELEGVDSGRGVFLEVRDRGTGIEPEAVEHLFEPFFTTKEPGQGTGLGLATVYGIVKQSGGAIEVENAPSGATFRILLPEALSEEAPGADEGDPRRRVLIVDDEEPVRRLAATFLEQAGYRVATAGDGREALALSEEDTEPFDVLVTDVVMPGLGGIELAERLARRDPGIRILLMSGFSEAARSRPAGQPFLQKPFTSAELVEHVEGLLED